MPQSLLGDLVARRQGRLRARCRLRWTCGAGAAERLHRALTAAPMPLQPRGWCRAHAARPGDADACLNRCWATSWRGAKAVCARDVASGGRVGPVRLGG